MKAKRTYKDSLFRHMFKHKRRITHLYAALSGNHVDPRDITFRTLRGTFFNDVKNDISFLVENRMVILLEQQSTWNPNMPLRFLWYLARLYRNIVPKDVPYHSSLVSLPAPEFYVLYNGMQAERDYQVLHLSDAFPARPSGESRLELDVPCYNINYAPGRKILEECYELRCYSIFVGKVRELSSNGIPWRKPSAVRSDIASSMISWRNISRKTNRRCWTWYRSNGTGIVRWKSRNRMKENWDGGKVWQRGGFLSSATL